MTKTFINMSEKTKRPYIDKDALKNINDFRDLHRLENQSEAVKLMYKKAKKYMPAISWIEFVEKNYKFFYFDGDECDELDEYTYEGFCKSDSKGIFKSERIVFKPIPHNQSSIELAIMEGNTFLWKCTFDKQDAVNFVQSWLKSES